MKLSEAKQILNKNGYVLNESEENYLGSSFHPVFMCMR